MTDSIVLPMSGVVLERSAEKGTHWRHYIGPFCIEVRDGGETLPGKRRLYPRWARSTGGGWSYSETLEDVVRYLDAVLLDARDALLPPAAAAGCHGQCPEALGYAVGVAAMRGERDAARNSALEEAAKVADGRSAAFQDVSASAGAQQVATAIRALTAVGKGPA